MFHRRGAKARVIERPHVPPFYGRHSLAQNREAASPSGSQSCGREVAGACLVTGPVPIGTDQLSLETVYVEAAMCY